MKWLKFFLDEFITFLVVAVVILGAIIIAGSLSGCGIVDFREKALATETKVIGLDCTVPSISTGNSLACVRLGYISTKYISAPGQSTASINDKYTDCSLLSVSGTVDSDLSVANNNTDTGK